MNIHTHHHGSPDGPARQPRVSVGIPVYNGEKYLPKAIESVLGQTYDDWELILSDNGSVDGTEAICRAAAAADPRVRYYREEVNRGVTWNFNRLVSLARGEYFKWNSHDDFCAPNMLECCVQELDQQPDAVLCYGKTATVDADGFRIVAGPGAEGDDIMGMQRLEDDWASQQLDAPQPSRRYEGILLHTMRCHESFAVIRTSILRETGLERAYVNGEKVLLAELALKGKFCHVPEYLKFTRWHDQQLSAIPSAVGQNLRRDPGASHYFVMPKQWYCARGYLTVIFQQRLPWTERIRCLLVFGKFVLQLRKWRHVLSDAIFGRATYVTLRDGRKRMRTEIGT